VASADAGGCVQESVAQGFGFAPGQGAVEQQVDRGQGEFQPGGVERELAGLEPAEAGVFAAAGPVLDRAWARCLACRCASWPWGGVGAEGYRDPMRRWCRSPTMTDMTGRSCSVPPVPARRRNG
jgi:hypothetical protein